MSVELYDVGKALFFGLFRTVWRMQAHGTRNVPAHGPLIVACNHISYFDPPLLGSACPRRLRYMAKAQLFGIPILGPAMRGVGAYPVEREGSAAAAIRRSVEVLRRGEAIGIFPEGTRNLQGTADVRSGVALLASLGKAPVVPACVLGTSRAKELARFHVIFGPPLRLPADRKATRDDMSNFTAQVMQAIRALPETISGN